MKLLTLLALASLVTFAYPNTASSVPQSGASALSQASTVRTFQHLTTRPPQPRGLRVIVEGEPGTEYELHVVNRAGRSQRIDFGVLPANGWIGKAYFLVGEFPDQPTDRVEVWSVSTSPIIAEVEILD